MVTLKIGSLADSGDLYPFIPLMEGWVKAEGVNLEFDIIPTVQMVNEKVMKKEVDVSVPSAALYPYIQDSYYVLSSAVASAVDGITGMPILSLKPVTREELNNSVLIVHGLNTTAFTLYRMFIGKYRKLIVVERVLDEIKALQGEGDVMVAVHELKAMYNLRKLGLKVNRVTSMWDMWKEASGGLPMPMGTVVVTKDYGIEVAQRFKEAYEKSKKFAEKNLEMVIPKDVEIMRKAQGVDLDKEIIESTIRTDIEEYNVPRELVRKGMKAFYDLASQKSILPSVKEIEMI